MGFYVFHQLRSYCDAIETWNISSRLVPRGLSEEPYTAPHNAALLCSDKANPLVGIGWRLEPGNSHFGARYGNHKATADPY